MQQVSHLWLFHASCVLPLCMSTVSNFCQLHGLIETIQENRNGWNTDVPTVSIDQYSQNSPVGLTARNTEKLIILYRFKSRKWCFPWLQFPDLGAWSKKQKEKQKIRNFCSILSYEESITQIQTGLISNHNNSKDIKVFLAVASIWFHWTHLLAAQKTADPRGRSDYLLPN